MLSLPTVGSIVAGKYRIEAPLGEGGMGAVFRAHHELMDKTVALKWLHPRLWDHAEAKERFLREARIVARIRHPNVVEVFDICAEPDGLFMVMELLEGDSLEQLLHAGTLPIPRALQLVLDAMHGVAAAHARGVIHRDIKAENIFIARSASGHELAKILDFGISKLAPEGDGEQMTKTGATMGTPAYMSFEHISGARDVDERTDVYSFGVLLYRLLTHELPYGSDSFANVAVRLATTRAPAPKLVRPELPVQLSDLVMKAMAFEREDRYPSMVALIDALAPLITDAGLISLLSLPSGTTPSALRSAQQRLGAPLPSTQAPRISAPVRTAPPRAARRWALWTLPAGAGALLILLWVLGGERTAAPARPPALPLGASLPPRDAAPAPALAPPLRERGADQSHDWESAAHKPVQVEAIEPSAPSAPTAATPIVPEPAAPPAVPADAAQPRSGRTRARSTEPSAPAATPTPKVRAPSSVRIRPDQF
jgi:serine/threonine-protein kinase